MTFKELATQMGVTEKDLTAFCLCLDVYTRKGFTVEQAIARHMQQMERLAGGCLKLPKGLVADTFFPVAA